MTDSPHIFVFRDQADAPVAWGQGNTPTSAKKRAEWMLTAFLRYHKQRARTEFSGSFEIHLPSLSPETARPRQ